MNASIKCIMLAGGYGTRLGSFGETTPKGLITGPTGKTLAESCLSEASASIPFENTAIVTNDRFYRTYRTWADHTFPNQPLKIINDGSSHPDNRLGAIGDLLYVLDALEWWDCHLLALPSDTYYSFSLSDFLKFGLLHPYGLSTVFRSMSKEQIAQRLGCASISQDIVTAFEEKPEIPQSPFAAIPFYFYPQSILSYLKVYAKSGHSLDAPGSIIPWMLASKTPVYAYITHDITLDVGTLREVNSLQTIGQP